MKKILSLLSLYCVFFSVQEISSMPLLEESQDGIGVVNQGVAQQIDDNIRTGIRTGEEGREQGITVYDPTYDVVSKKLFSNSEHFINFINSIFYPMAGVADFKVREVEVLGTESNSDSLFVKPNGQVGAEKLIRFDCVYKCTCYSVDPSNVMRKETKQIFNLEMQRKLNACEYQGFNDRMLYYASRLFDTNASQQDFIPVKGLVLMDSIVDDRSEILSHNFVTQYVSENTIVNARIASDKIFSIYIQLPMFVKEHRFTGNEQMKYCIGNTVYSLQKESLNWLKLYCAHLHGVRQEPSKYLIELDSSSSAYSGAKTIQEMTDSMKEYLRQEEKALGIFNDQIKEATKQGIQQGIQQGIIESEYSTFKRLGDDYRPTRRMKSIPQCDVNSVLNLKKRTKDFIEAVNKRKAPEEASEA